MAMTNQRNELPGVRELSGDVQALIDQLKLSAAANDRLATAVERDNRNRNRWLGGIAAGVLLLLLSVTWLLIRQDASSDRGQTIKNLTTTIADCVNPGGGCYERVQRQKQADRQRDQLLAVSVATCSANGLRGAALNACVRDSLAAADTPSSGATPAPRNP